MAYQSDSIKLGVPPTPPLPDELRQVNLTENARQVLIRRYVRRGDDGQPVESVEEMFWRVAYHIARVEETWGSDVLNRARQFYALLTSKRFFPNSPTFTGAGTPLGQLAACFVLPITDDMGRSPTGIFQTLRSAALIQQTGGGNGFSFSRLRPKGSLVKSSAGQATGPIGFLRVYDHAFGEVAQGGTRRGANMAVLRVDHPDIEEFITCKTNENAITNFNISVGITDAFMQAVAADADWDLCFPDVSSREYRGFDGTLEQAQAAGIPLRVYRTVRARDLFQKIVTQAHHNGEPGVLFLDAANRTNPVPHLYQLEATNPCGEQWLGPFENCCLGSVNLAQHFGPNGKVDWETLRESIVLSTIFLDDVVDANMYVPAVPELAEAAHRARRIGLGIMGLADLMYHVGVRYGSPESLEFASQVMEFVRYHAMLTSINLSAERGPFPAFPGSHYDPNNGSWQPPQSSIPYTREWGRPQLDWNSILEGIRQNGIRNAAQNTIAPTGTIATVAGCEGYGCEPVFALAYIRHVNDNGKDLQLAYASPLFEQALTAAGIASEARQAIIDRVMQEGSCQDIPELSGHFKDVFVVSQDIPAEDHVRMQAALQAFVDNSLSKTINFPHSAKVEQVATAYQLAWELGCKGITVYVTGSREKVVLETKATLDKKQPVLPPLPLGDPLHPFGYPEAGRAPEGAGGRGEGETHPVETPTLSHNGHVPVETPSLSHNGHVPGETISTEQIPIWHESKKPRPRFLKGFTYSIATPLGKAFITINENGGDQPFEVFIITSKAGSDTAAVSDAIGRLISYILRLSSSVEPRERLQEIIRQLSGIGGGRPLGFGPNRVRSLPDGVAHILNDYMASRIAGELDPDCTKTAVAKPAEESPAVVADQPFLKIGDLCPECGQAAMVNEEGCHKCYACGYSEC